MRLTDEELQDVLARAEEIERSAQHGRELHAEMEVVIGAGEAVGLSRSALERALRERLDLPVARPTTGMLAFATSTDGKSYVAEVVSMSDDGVLVRFLNGSERIVAADELRPCVMNPGARVVCNWPWWGPWTCTVMAFDTANQSVTLSDGWGSVHVCSLGEVWLAAPRKEGGTQAARRRGMMLLATGTVIGALVGSIVTALLMWS